MKKNLLYTLKFAPVVAFVTIGVCMLTALGAKLVGVALPEQANVGLVKSWAGWNVKFLLVILQVVFLVPIFEEVLFRGLLFKGVVWGMRRARRSRPTNSVGADVLVGPIPIAIAFVSSALFSAAHYLMQPWPDNAFLALFFFGLAQCYLYKRTNAIAYLMLNHAFFNALNLALLFILPEQGTLP